MSAPPSEAARRKNVQDAIDRVLFKVCNAGQRVAPAHCRLPPHVVAPKLPPPRAPFPVHSAANSVPIRLHLHSTQINELEAILGNFTGQNELLHAKL